MRVWRVEDYYGDGPYTEKNIYNEYGETMALAHGDESHPNPYEDGLEDCVSGRRWDGVDTGDTVCGMSTYEGLMKWFDGWWEPLHREGYIIAEYEVPREYVAIGNSGQVMFVKPKGYKVKEEAAA